MTFAGLHSNENNNLQGFKTVGDLLKFTFQFKFYLTL